MVKNGLILMPFGLVKGFIEYAVGERHARIATGDIVDHT